VPSLIIKTINRLVIKSPLLVTRAVLSDALKDLRSSQKNILAKKIFFKCIFI
jgi:hypothetical protein